MTRLARKLRLGDYFTLGFGTMIGVGWLVLMDDWLGRGGPLGAALGFLIGAVVLLPVGYVYGKWALRLPDAAGEAAYTAQVFPPLVSFVTGWMMLLAYFIVCPWEAVAVGRIAAYIFPQLDSFEVYSVAGHPVFLPRLLLGIGLTGLLTFLNYRGIRLSANFQNWSAGGMLFLFLFVLGISARHGTPANFQPLFAAAPAASILLTLQIVPYFLTGFESVAKCAEEAHPGFRGRSFGRAIALALIVGALFYALTIAAVAYIEPWKALEGKRFATAIAFEHAVGARWPVRIILTMAVFGLFEVFNGNLVASSRLLYAYGRRGMVGGAFGRVHARFQTPGVAVLAIGAGTLVGLALGDAILVPVTEVGSGASTLGWLATCASFFLVERKLRLRLAAAAGAIASLALVLIKILPGVPGHFSRWEWAALAVWLGIGFLFRRYRGGKEDGGVPRLRSG